MTRTIGLDVDGVLADFGHGWRELAHEYYGVPIYSNGAQLTWSHGDLTEPQVAHLWAIVDDTNGEFWRRLGTVISDGEISDCRALASEGVDFVYVTARHLSAELATRQWLDFHGLPYGPVRIASDKRPVLASVDGLVGFLDDSPHGVQAMHEAGQPVFVRDWPYNRGPLVRAPRVYSVGEYLAAVAQ